MLFKGIIIILMLGVTTMYTKTKDKKLGFKILLNTTILTFLALIFSYWGVFSLHMSIFKDHSAEAQTIYIIESFFIVTTFTIILCTSIILVKLDGNKP